MPRQYFLSPTAIRHLRDHKIWSIEHFGKARTKRYFQDLDKGFQYIADHYQSFPSRSQLTGNTGLSIYPVEKHYVVFVPLADGIHIADVLGQSQDIPHILNEHAAVFERELALFKASAKSKPRKRGRPRQQ